MQKVVKYCKRVCLKGWYLLILNNISWRQPISCNICLSSMRVQNIGFFAQSVWHYAICTYMVILASYNVWLLPKDPFVASMSHPASYPPIFTARKFVFGGGDSVEDIIKKLSTCVKNPMFTRTTVTAITGPMQSGKTWRLLREIKTNFPDEDPLSSRIFRAYTSSSSEGGNEIGRREAFGSRVKCSRLKIDSFTDVLSTLCYLCQSTDVGATILLDEAQQMPFVFHFVYLLKAMGRNVIVSYLSRNYRMELFPSVKNMDVLCERVERLTSSCHACGALSLSDVMTGCGGGQPRHGVAVATTDQFESIQSCAFESKCLPCISRSANM